jgi:DNA polymerase-2
VELDCFLLTRQWRDGPQGLELELWGASELGPVRVRVTGQEAVCFIESDAVLPPLPGAGPGRRASVALASLEGAPVDALYFRRQRDLVEARGALKRAGVRVLESDIKPVERFLMERFVTAGFTVRGEPVERGGFVEVESASVRPAQVHPRLRRCSVDIETEGLEGRLYSVALAGPEQELILMVGDGSRAGQGLPIRWCHDEHSLIEDFLAQVRDADPDLLVGWNVVGFDLDFLARRARTLGVPFTLGRAGERAAVLAPGGGGGVHVARVPGRVVLDGIECLRAAFWTFESYDLETVSRKLLGRGKDIAEPHDREAEINRLYAEDPVRLARYNLEDCRLVESIFERADLVKFAMRRAELTGLALDRIGGSVAAFDNLYLPRLHRRGRVASDVTDVPSGPASPGGYVLDSRPGLYDNVLLLDFKSLYPSIIRTFRIDPYGLAAPGDDSVPGFLGAHFARQGAILPGLIEELWAARDEARREGDGALSQAVKILMNSFYGVLGAPGCRFHDPRLASSITLRGHEIIRASRERIEALGREVIYGDTDSLFVLLGAGVDEDGARAAGVGLAHDLNGWWRERIAREHRLESCLEIEFETHFLRFLMPTVRGDSTGSKKRYAGLVRTADAALDVVFKGLESVRTDWTPLARRFQRELYRRIFVGEPYEDFVGETLRDLMAGRLDQELVYAKRLRRDVADYQRNVPPHVQAARKLGRPTRRIRYVITVGGPEPVEDGLPKPDYAHYRDRQLAPAADGILQFLGTSFEALTDQQLAMF